MTLPVGRWQLSLFPDFAVEVAAAALPKVVAVATAQVTKYINTYLGKECKVKELARTKVPVKKALSCV